MERGTLRLVLYKLSVVHLILICREVLLLTSVSFLTLLPDSCTPNHCAFKSLPKCFVCLFICLNSNSMAFYYYYSDFNSTLNIVTLLQFGLDAFFFWILKNINGRPTEVVMLWLWTPSGNFGCMDQGSDHSKTGICFSRKFPLGTEFL